MLRCVSRWDLLLHVTGHVPADAAQFGKHERDMQRTLEEARQNNARCGGVWHPWGAEEDGSQPATAQISYVARLPGELCRPGVGDGGWSKGPALAFHTQGDVGLGEVRRNDSRQAAPCSLNDAGQQGELRACTTLATPSSPLPCLRAHGDWPRARPFLQAAQAHAPRVACMAQLLSRVRTPHVAPGTLRRRRAATTR